tara:strand:+ start:149 stop:361 length:213 start_codon:yes stop_codon:yes gene_type:complete
MNIDNWVAGKVQNGKEATVSLALLETGLPDEIPSLRFVESWAKQLADKLGCKATIHFASDVVTFYPVSKT